MKYITVTTPDNIGIKYRLAGAGSRLAAASIDTIIQFTFFASTALAAFFFLFGLEQKDIYLGGQRFIYFLTFLIITYFLIFFGYFLLAETIMKGQTIGKRILSIRTIRQNGRPITFIQSIVRNLVRVFIDNQGIGLILMLLTKEHKRLGDMMAGTVVVAENPGHVNSQSLWVTEIAAYEFICLNAPYPITREEYEILKDYFARRDDFVDLGLRAQDKLTEYFCEKFNLLPEDVDESVLYRFMVENSSNY